MDRIMTLEDCKRIHRDMWNYIAGAEERNNNLRRKYLKDHFCSRSRSFLINGCALCQYALERYNAYNNCTIFNVSSDVCEFCPALWGTEREKYGYYCESEVDGPSDRIDWRHSKAVDIRDIKWKDEVK